MFSFRKSVIAAMAVGMIFTVGACKRSGGSGVTAQGLTSSWQVEEVNSLLAYVPADAPIVYASTRNIDMNAPQAKALLAKAAAMYDKSFAQLEKSSSSLDEDSKKLLETTKKSMESSVALLKNYQTEAPNWGLEPNGRQDSVFYVNNDVVAGHVTVVDGAKLKTKMDAVFSSLMVAGETKAFKNSEIGSGDNAWTLYQPDQVTDPESPLPTIAVRYGKNLVTFVLVNGAPDVNKLAELTKPAAKGMSKDNLGTIDKEAMAVGFMDSAKIIDLLQLPSVAILMKAAEVEIDATCASEYKALASSFPRVQFSQRILNDGKVQADSTLVFADKAEVKKLQALHSSSVNLKSAKTIVNAAINVQLDKAIPYLSDLSKVVSAKNFKCDTLQSLAGQLSSFPELASNPDVTKYASAVSSISAVVDGFDLTTKKVDATVDINGAKLGELMPEITSMLSALGAAIEIKKDEVTNFDLTPLIQWPVVIKMTYTDTDFVVATTEHDVKALAKSSKSATTNFAEVGVSFKILSSIADLGDTFNDVSYDFALGTNDDGLRFSMIIGL